MNNNIYPIDKNSSNIAKGILILLIVIGHNKYITDSTNALYSYLYMFHISSFFLMPFLYGTEKKLSSKNIFNNLIKLFVPYLISLLLIVCIHIFIFKKHLTHNEIKEILLYGNLNPIGALYLWFLPAFFFMHISYLFYNNANIYIKIAIITIWLILICLEWNYIWNNLFKSIPYNIIRGFYYFGYGIIAQNIITKIKYTSFLGSISFIVASICYFTSNFNNRTFFIITGFIFIITISTLIKSKVLENIGKQSLYIYLFHQIILNVLYVVLDKNIINGILSLIISLIASYAIGKYINNRTILRQLLFPKNATEMKEIFYKLIIALKGYRS